MLPSLGKKLHVNTLYINPGMTAATPAKDNKKDSLLMHPLILDFTAF